MSGLTDPFPPNPRLCQDGVCLTAQGSARAAQTSLPPRLSAWRPVRSRATIRSLTRRGRTRRQLRWAAWEDLRGVRRAPKAYRQRSAPQSLARPLGRGTARSPEFGPVALLPTKQEFPPLLPLGFWPHT